MKRVLISAVEFVEAAVMWFAIALTTAMILTAMLASHRPAPVPQPQYPLGVVLDRSIT